MYDFSENWSQPPVAGMQATVSASGTVASDAYRKNYQVLTFGEFGVWENYFIKFER